MQRIKQWINRPFTRFRRTDYEPALLVLARAFTVGVAYVSASPIPGLTSSFVAIFTSLLPFDMIVASGRPPVRWGEWNSLIVVLRPRIIATAITLLKGVAVGGVMGVAVILGMSHQLGAVFTTGLSYIWALSTRNNISTFVALMAGLSLFERLAALDVVQTVQVLRVIVTAIIASGGGTLLALVAGWAVGLVTGSVTRLLLSKPYRSLRSSAYDLPMEMRPFNEVLHIGKSNFIVTVKVEPDAPLAHTTLSQSRLGERWGTTVLAVKRGKDEFVMPTGEATLLPGDELTLLTPRDESSDVYVQFRRADVPPADGRDDGLEEAGGG